MSKNVAVYSLQYFCPFNTGFQTNLKYHPAKGISSLVPPYWALTYLHIQSLSAAFASQNLYNKKMTLDG